MGFFTFSTVGKEKVGVYSSSLLGRSILAQSTVGRDTGIGGVRVINCLKGTWVGSFRGSIGFLCLWSNWGVKMSVGGLVDPRNPPTGPMH